MLYKNIKNNYIILFLKNKFKLIFSDIHPGINCYESALWYASKIPCRCYIKVGEIYVTDYYFEEFIKVRENYKLSKSISSHVLNKNVFLDNKYNFKELPKNVEGGGYHHEMINLTEIKRKSHNAIDDNNKYK